MHTLLIIFLHAVLTVYLVDSVFIIFLLFFLFRIQYAFQRMIKTTDAIYNYESSLINSSGNLYKKMALEYNKYILAIWLWGKYSAIKDEYIEILKPYFD